MTVHAQSGVSNTQRRSPTPSDWIVWRLRVLFGDPIPKHELGLFFDRLAMLLHSGMGIPESLRQASRSGGLELQRICESAARPVSAGVPLHRALVPWKDRLPEIVLPILEVGEVSGTLESASRRLAEAFDKSAGIEQRFRYTVFDPWLLILLLAVSSIATSFAIGVVAIVLTFLKTLLVLTAMYLLARLAARFLFKWQPLRVAVDSVKLAVPHMGAVSRNLSSARWARSFATMWHCGVPVSTALEVASRSALNAHYRRALLRASVRTQAGWTLHESLAETDLLPRYLLPIIETGETSGKLAQSLDQFVRIMEDEAMTMGTQGFVTVVAAIKIIAVIAAVAFATR